MAPPRAPAGGPAGARVGHSDVTASERARPIRPGRASRHKEVAAYSDHPPATALVRHYSSHRRALLGQIDQHPGPRGQGGRLVAERTLAGPSRRCGRGPLHRSPAVKRRHEFVTSLSVVPFRHCGATVATAGSRRPGRRTDSLARSTPVSTTVTVTVPNHLMPRLVGPLNENLRLVEDAFEGTSIHARGNEFTIDGDDAALAARLVDEMRLLLEQGQALDPEVVHRTIDMVRADERPSEVLTAEVLRSARGRSVRPKTSGQKRYADAIRDSVVTFGVGPAGTGKSYLAVALAVQALQAKQVDRIILTRPAVEAGERLGFLPGDLMAKIDPYLRPLYDALYDMLGTEGARRLLDAGTVEVAPLAYMRGRTLNNSFIILDEAQNTTPEQMKMFLTRIGFGSKVVVTGDDTQVDLPGGRSGLIGLDQVLVDIEGLSWVRLGRRDVVRHRIVADIVNAYEEADQGSRSERLHGANRGGLGPV